MSRAWSPVLSHLSPSELDRLMSTATTRDVAKGAFILLAGEPARGVHVIDDGLVKLMATDARGSEILLGLLSPGDLFGEAAVLASDVHELDAVAATPVRTTFLDAASFLDLVSSNGVASLALARWSARRARFLTRLNVERTAGRASQRLAGSLLDLSEVIGRRRGATIEMELPFGQADIANLAGVARETACRGLREMRSEGIVDYRRRRLRILRPELLERLRCGHEASG